MKITILGAAGGEVTGSCYLVQTSQARVLVDCGLFQGSRNADSLNAEAPVTDPAHLDAVRVVAADLVALLGSRAADERLRRAVEVNPVAPTS